jgi:hypothetical protein
MSPLKPLLPSGKELLRDGWPALVVLLLTLLYSTLIGEFTFVSGARASWVVFVRFFYLSLILLVPMVFLPGLCRLVQNLMERKPWRVVHIPEQRNRDISRMKNWLLRPLQGIGLMMLLATKLLAILYTGAAAVSAIQPPMRFHPGRFLTVSVIALLASFLLQYLWTMDDLGVRLHHRKSGEVKIIGKYLGLMLPIFFGFYGILSLAEVHSRVLTASYVAQIAVVLYPPFVLLNTFHARYIRRHEVLLLRYLNASPLVIVTNGEPTEADDSFSR